MFIYFRGKWCTNIDNLRKGISIRLEVLEVGNFENPAIIIFRKGQLITIGRRQFFGPIKGQPFATDDFLSIFQFIFYIIVNIFNVGWNRSWSFFYDKFNIWYTFYTKLTIRGPKIYLFIDMGNTNYMGYDYYKNRCQKVIETKKMYNWKICKEIIKMAYYKCIIWVLCLL